MNILNILKEALIGKELRVCVYSRPIYQPKTEVTRIPGATKKQFQNNPERFGSKFTYNICLGYHRIYETHTIINVVGHCDEDGNYFEAHLDNGTLAVLRADDYIPHSYTSTEW